jgi:FixJ family two-component response regulator
MNPRLYATTAMKTGTTARNGQTYPVVGPSSCVSVDAVVRVFVVGQNNGSPSLATVLKSAGFRTVTFDNTSDLVASSHLHPPCCVLLDLDLPASDLSRVQSELTARFEFMPVVVLSEKSSLELAIAAMKAGAVDYLVKPVDAATLSNAIKVALAKQTKLADFSKCSAKYHLGLQRLTGREREVLSFITNGFLNKQIAAELGISEKTIKVHRGRVMKKMQVTSFAELVRLTERASILEHLSQESFSSPSRQPVNGDRSTDAPHAAVQLAPTCSL